MLRNWSYPEFKEILYKEAREGEDHKYSSVYRRIYAYLRILELRGMRLNPSEVGTVIKSEANCIPPKTTMSRWMRNLGTPLRNISVFDVHQPEVGLVMGLILSDGFERKHYRNYRFHGVRLEFVNKNEGLLKVFKESCHRLGLSAYRQINYSPTGQEVRKLKVESTLLFLLVRRYDVFIVRAPADEQLAFIKGLWLGDGYIGDDIVFYNTDLRLVRVASTILREHDIEHSIQGPHLLKSSRQKSMYRIYVRKRSRELFLALTGLAESPPRPPF